MFTLRQPTPPEVERFLVGARSQTFSYTETGATRGQIPAGYTVDHNRVRLGSGEETFRAAVAALRAWKMFHLGWVHLFQPDTPIEVDREVAIVVRHFGFAYGTLQQHAERGEERFSVEWDPESGAVFYDILAFSRPRQWQARAARPLSRKLQKRFARDSMAAMERAVRLERA